MKKNFSIILIFIMMFIFIPTVHADSDPIFIVQPKYKFATEFSEGLAWVSYGNDFNWGVIDTNGNRIVEPKYFSNFNITGDYSFKEGFSRTNIGVIDITGKTIDFVKDGMVVSNFNEGAARFTTGGGRQFGFVDKNSKVIVQPKYSRLSDFHEGLALFSNWSDQKVGWAFGFVDKSGREIVKPVYDEAFDFSEGLAAVKKQNKWGFVNKLGKEIIKPQFDNVYSFSEGLASVSKNDKWGFIDKSGKLVINYQYESIIQYFNGGLAQLYKPNVGYVYIDKKGNVVLKHKYDYAGEFQDGVAVVTKHFYDAKGQFLYARDGLINKKGHEIIKPKYEQILHDFHEGLIRVIATDGKMGFIDKNGREIIKPQFESVLDFSEGLAAVKKDGKYGYILNPLVIKVKINDEYVMFDQLPVTQNSRTLVPMRGIFERLGAEIEWDNKNNTVIAKKDGIRIVVPINSKYITINDKQVEMDISAQIINGRTLVPIRFVSEALNADIKWDEQSKTVMINTVVK